VYITVEPEPLAAPGPIPAMRVKVYLDGSREPAIEIQSHTLDPDVLPAIAATADGSGPNDGTGLGMGLWRSRQGGYLDVDYFGVLDGAVPPGVVAGVPFKRGNCNGDAGVDIADAIFGLNYLFQGGAAPPCPEACRVNPDGALDLSDSVFLLSYLFLGGPAPREPFPACDMASAVECGRDACP
ncbi:MAG: hypothetical protein HY721_26195, partial [Planctomycetes bacterium]|nr:hypothetical protein [Planctomycetota bacterium]